MKKDSYQRLLIYSVIIVAIVVFFASAIMFGNYDTHNLWPRIVGALFGVVLSAIITMLLLSGQTNNALEKERNSEIFREKLRLYQGFLSKLCEVLKDGKITREEAVELQFLLSYISLHTNSDHIRDISRHTATIIHRYIGHQGVDQDEERKLLHCLYDIVAIFRTELYAQDKHWNESDLKEIISNLIVLDDPKLYAEN